MSRDVGICQLEDSNLGGKWVGAWMLQHLNKTVAGTVSGGLSVWHVARVFLFLSKSMQACLSEITMRSSSPTW